MRFTPSLQDAAKLVTGGCVATIGNFDGVHLGHQALIKKIVDQKKQAGLPAILITFTPHPIFLFKPDMAPRMLMTDENKLNLIKSLGVDACIVLPFTHKLANLSPEEFVKEILVDSLAVQHLYVGHDYAFGKGRQGNAKLLAELGKKYAFSVEQIKAVDAMEGVVSSTRIRSRINEGRVEKAGKLLGRPYFIDGQVGHGKNRGGTQLGYPTANMTVPDNLIIPKPGVYATRLEIRQKTKKPGKEIFSPLASSLCGVTNVGYNPTFGDVPLSIETHILDFNQDLYDASLRLWFMHRLRDEQKFSSVQELKNQISKDTEKTRELLS